MTLDLDAIRARAEAATTGPWVADETEIYSEFIGGTWVAESLDIEDRAKGKANGEFIAHARQDIPDLLAEVDRLTAALAEADLVIASMRLAIDEADAEEVTL